MQDDTGDTYHPKYLDRTLWLRRQEYWALHVILFVKGYGGEMDDEAICDAFGVSKTVVEEFYKAEFQGEEEEGDEYPCYRLALPVSNQASIALEYHNYPEDHHMQFQLYRKAAKESILIGYYDGQSWHPAMRWSDLCLIARHVSQVTDDSTMRHAAVPLLFPAVLLNAGDDFAEITDRLAKELESLGVLQRESTVKIANCMVDESRGLGDYVRRHANANRLEADWLAFLTTTFERE